MSALEGLRRVARIGNGQLFEMREFAMTFQSDSGARRTIDADGGWELFRERTGDPLSFAFRVVHSSGKKISFTGDNVAAVEVAQRDGVRQFLKRWRVYRVVVDAEGMSNSAARAVIEDALRGFGLSFDGPSGPVEIDYVSFKAGEE